MSFLKETRTYLSFAILAAYVGVLANQAKAQEVATDNSPPIITPVAKPPSSGATPTVVLENPIPARHKTKKVPIFSSVSLAYQPRVHYFVGTGFQPIDSSIDPEIPAGFSLPPQAIQFMQPNGKLGYPGFNGRHADLFNLEVGLGRHWLVGVERYQNALFTPSLTPYAGFKVFQRKMLHGRLAFSAATWFGARLEKDRAADVYLNVMGQPEQVDSLHDPDPGRKIGGKFASPTGGLEFKIRFEIAKGLSIDIGEKADYRKIETLYGFSVLRGANSPMQTIANNAAATQGPGIRLIF